MLDWLKNLLSKFIDGFKMKNPVQFTIVALALGVVYFGMDATTAATLPDGAPLLGEAARNILEKAQAVLVVVLALLGSHTPQNTSKT